MVYVDPAKSKLGRMIMCHMVADSLNELHQMADRVGVARKHFQNHGKIPHYDICKSNREKAIKYGAKEVSSKDLVRAGRRCLDGC